jgi:hypothetical protein
MMPKLPADLRRNAHGRRRPTRRGTDEAQGVWKVSKVGCLHLNGALPLISVLGGPSEERI